jgi:hypothetical protein
MKNTEHNNSMASRLYYKAESIWSDFQANHCIDPIGWYDSTSMEREDMLFFFPVVSADFDWSDAEARKGAMRDMDYVIGVSHDTILDTVQEWYAQADSDGLGRFVVNELVAEYLPQMLARESALCEYRGKMIDVLAEAARTRWDR